MNPLCGEDKILGVEVVFAYACGDGEYIGVEDYIFGVEIEALGK